VGVTRESPSGRYLENLMFGTIGLTLEPAFYSGHFSDEDAGASRRPWQPPFDIEITWADGERTGETKRSGLSLGASREALLPPDASGPALMTLPLGFSLVSGMLKPY
jgi:hypothetical protein